jgi:hypothetical protein
MDMPDYLNENDDDDYARLAEIGRERCVMAAPARRTAAVATRTSSATVELRSAASIRPETIKWLWPGWLARGRFHILAGQPGAGKTTLALELAATISSGGIWPDGVLSVRGNTIFWSGEDDLADTLVPRLIAAGADCQRIHFVGRACEDGRSRPFDPARDMSALETEIQRVGDVVLVVIDPVALIVTKDSNKNAETRRDLQPLADLSRATGAAALGIHHLAKATAGREPQERLIGSVAFAAVPRVVMIAAKKPVQDGAPDRRILMRAKSNIGPDEGGFAYMIEQVALEQHPEVPASRVVWDGRVEGSARAALADTEEPCDRDTALEDAKDFLRETLAEEAVAQKELKSAAEAHGHAWATVRRAKKALGVVARKASMAAGWDWNLPKALTNPEEAQAFGVSPFEDFEPLREKSKAPGLDEEVEF